MTRDVQHYLVRARKLQHMENQHGVNGLAIGPLRKLT